MMLWLLLVMLWLMVLLKVVKLHWRSSHELQNGFRWFCDQELLRLMLRHQWFQGNWLRDWNKSCCLRDSAHQSLLVEVRRKRKSRPWVGSAVCRIGGDHRRQAVVGHGRMLIGRRRREPVTGRAVPGRETPAGLVHLHLVAAIRVRAGVALVASQIRRRPATVDARQIQDPVVVDSERRRRRSGSGGDVSVLVGGSGGMG